MLFTDTAFANNQEFKQQLGFIVPLVDGKNNSNLVHFGSNRCARVTRSVMASELHALMDLITNILFEKRHRIFYNDPYQLRYKLIQKLRLRL